MTRHAELNARSSYPPHSYPHPQYHYTSHQPHAPVIPPVLNRSRSKSDPHRPGIPGRHSTDSATYIVVPTPPGGGPIYAPVQGVKYPTPSPQYHSSRQPHVYTSSPHHGHRQAAEYPSPPPHRHDSPSYKNVNGIPLQVVQDKGYRSKNSYTSSGQQEVKYVYASGAGPVPTPPPPPPHVIKPKRTAVLFYDEKAHCYREGWMEEDDKHRHQHHQGGPHPPQEEVDWADRPQTPMTYDQLNKRVHAWLDRAEKENAVGIAQKAKEKDKHPGWMDKLRRGAHHSGVAA